MPSPNTPDARPAQAKPDDDNDPDRVVKGWTMAAQDEVTIDVTACGDLVLRQQDALGKEPAVIVIRRANLKDFICAIDHLCGGLNRHIQVWWSDLDDDAPTAATTDKVEAPTTIKHSTDRTNAERQPRYRERRRNARDASKRNGSGAVTASD